MAAYTHLSINANTNSLTEWVDAYNILITDINQSGLRLGATLIGNGVSSAISLSNTTFQVGNTTSNVVMYANGSMVVGGDLTVQGTIIGTTINVPVANTTANGTVSTTTQSFAGIKTFTQNVVVQGVLTGNVVGSATSVTGNINSPTWAKFSVQGTVDGGSTRGIYMYDIADSNWGIYMAQSGALKSLNNNTASQGLASGRTGWHLRFRAASAATHGFLWENHSDVTLMSLSSDTGNLHLLGSGYANWFRALGDTGVYFEAYSRGLWSVDSGAGTYGHVMCYGSGKNGWGGYAINTRHVYMSNGSNQSGLYDTSVGWVLQWDGVNVTNMHNIYPHDSATYYLGSTSKKWKTAYFDLTSVASGGQVVIDAGTGALQYISSSLRYKTDIQPLDSHIDPMSWLAVDPIVYRDKTSPESGQYYGFLAEDLHDKGFRGMVVYDTEGRPNSLMYDRATVFLTAIVKKQQHHIEQLESRLHRLELSLPPSRV